LDRDLPEILIECQQDTAIRLREIQQRNVAGAREVHPRPDHIVTGLP